MSEDEGAALLVEFKLVLARAVEEHLLRELAAAARTQRRRLPAIAKNLVRTGALDVVVSMPAADVARFASGKTWTASFQAAVEDGSWARLVDRCLRAALPAGSG